MALPQPQFVDALLTTLEDPANQSPELATALREAADTYSEDETDALLAGKADNADLSTKADLDSPTFTGTPAVPTADPGTDTTQAASTAFVKAAIDALPSGGDVTGPAGATAGNFPALDATGKILSDSGSKPADFQPVDADLTAIAALVSAANKLPYATGAGTWAMTDFSAFGRTLVDDADAATARTTLGVVIGTDVQAYDADTAKTDVAQQFSKPQWASATALTSGTTVTPDLADNNDFTLTLAHNATLANPSNQSTHVNQKGTITITQDGSGGHTLSFGSNWKAIGSASAPSINTTAGVTSCIDYHVLSSTVIRYSLRAVGAA